MWEWCSWMRVIATNWLVRKWVCLAIYHLCFNCLIGIQVTTRTTSIHTVHQKHWNNQLIVAMVISGYFVIVWQMGSVLLWSLLINVQVEIVVLFYRFQTSPHWYWLLLSLLCSEKEIFKKKGDNSVTFIWRQMRRFSSVQSDTWIVCPGTRLWYQCWLAFATNSQYRHLSPIWFDQCGRR